MYNNYGKNLVLRRKTGLKSEIDRSTNMLSNQNFISKAPKQKVDEEKNKLSNYQNSYNTLLEKKKDFE